MAPTSVAISERSYKLQQMLGDCIKYSWWLHAKYLLLVHDPALWSVIPAGSCPDH